MRGHTDDAASWPTMSDDMSARVRAFDWGATSLGRADDWPAGVRAVVELALASPTIASVALGPERRLIYNDAAGRHFGERHPGALGQPLASAFPDSYPAVAAYYDRVFAGASVVARAQPLTLATGDEVFDAYLTPVRGPDGAVAGAHMVGLEIGDALRSQQVLRESEERFRTFVTASSDVVFRMGPDWTEMRELQGRAFLSDLVEPSRGWLDRYIPPGEQPGVRDAIEQATRTRATFALEHRVIRADGSLGWMFSRAGPILSGDGEIKEWLGAASDITARKEAEAALRDREERLEVLVAELQHRVRNMLTVVHSVFTRTMDLGGDLGEVADHFTGRLDALARTQVVVTQSADGLVDLENLIRDELLSVGAADGPSLTIAGPEVRLTAKEAELIGLALHELTTNALKYGALKVAGARLDIGWTANLNYFGKRQLDLRWAEQGMPAISVKPTRHGFGSELIREALPYRLGAETKLQFRGGGVLCTISVPLHDQGVASGER